MHKRCYKKYRKDYYLYGGRGIKVCKRWRDFVVFFSDMGEPPKGHSLDRKNNCDDYELSNCRWALPCVQSRNTRLNNYLSHNGERLCIGDWETRLGLSKGAIHHRLKNGWPLTKALTTRKIG